MEFSSNNYSFVIEKTSQESWEQYYLRCQAIAKYLDKYPENYNKLDEISQMSHYWIAYKYMKCRYKKWIENKINELFNS